MSKAIRQHLIDPEICIRCYTCEDACPIDAITHDDNNVVVDAGKCNYTMDCIAPCPTGAIDNWRYVNEAYSVDEQLTWDELPEQADLGDDGGTLGEAIEDDIGDLIARAHAGTGGRSAAPASAASPSINLFSRANPAVATVQGAYRITDADTGSDVRHIILGFGETSFPVLEGQSVGIAPPGARDDGRPHDIRLYSVSSARDGEKRNGNNIALTVKREGKGLCSNYLCDLVRGDKVNVSGPFGSTFLMPNDPNCNVVMICTGTGSAPFRAFTERRRRAMPGATGQFVLYFGARSPGELPYFGPLKKVPAALLEQHLVYSRLADAPKEYVQDRMRTHAGVLAGLLESDRTHIFICGLKGMESGVDEALADVCRAHSLAWADIKPAMREQGRYHVETY